MARSVESRRTEQTIREPGNDEVINHALSDVSSTPSPQVQIDPASVRLIDRETNTAEVDIRPP